MHLRATGSRVRRRSGYSFQRPHTSPAPIPADPDLGRHSHRPLCLNCACRCRFWRFERFCRLSIYVFRVPGGDDERPAYGPGALCAGIVWLSVGYRLFSTTGSRCARSQMVCLRSEKTFTNRSSSDVFRREDPRALKGTPATAGIAVQCARGRPGCCKGIGAIDVRVPDAGDEATAGLHA